LAKRKYLFPVRDPQTLGVDARNTEVIRKHSVADDRDRGIQGLLCARLAFEAIKMLFD
jgi:hypothetical protein